MPKKKSDRHKPNRIVRIPEALAVKLERVAKRNRTNVTQETISAVRAYLSLQSTVNNARPL